MKNIINSAPFRNILDEKQVSMLTNAHEYVNQIRIKADDLYSEADAYFEIYKNRLEKQYQEKLISITDELRKQNQLQLESFVEKYVDELENVVYQVLNKMHIFNPDGENLRSLITEKLSDIIDSVNLTIVVHSDNLDKIKQELNLNGINVDKIEIKVDDSFNLSQICLKDELSTIYVDFENLAKKIQAILKQDHENLNLGE